MWSRGSITGILSRDLFSRGLFGGDTPAIGRASDAGVRFLGLDVIATGARRDFVSEEMSRNMNRNWSHQRGRCGQSIVLIPVGATRQ